MAFTMFKRRHDRAVVPEQEAIKLAKSKGYDVLGTQLVRHITLSRDDKLVRVEVRADLQLKKWGRRYLGQLRANTDPASKDVRLVLLQFREAFKADGVLLFEADGKKFVRIDFEKRFRIPIIRLMVLAAVLGSAVEARYKPGKRIARLVDYYLVRP